MTDPRFQDLARQLVHRSTQVTAGDKLLIEAIDVPRLFVEALIEACNEVGGIPFVQLRDQSVWRAVINSKLKKEPTNSCIKMIWVITS